MGLKPPDVVGDLVERQLTAAGAYRAGEDPAVRIHQAGRAVERCCQCRDDRDGRIEFGCCRDELALRLERLPGGGGLLLLQQVRDVAADRDERGRTWHLEEIHLVSAAGFDEFSGGLGVGESDREPDARHAGVGQPAHVAVPLAVPGTGFQTGGQQDLAALQERPRIGELTGGHPADRRSRASDLDGTQSECAHLQEIANQHHPVSLAQC